MARPVCWRAGLNQGVWNVKIKRAVGFQRACLVLPTGGWSLTISGFGQLGRQIVERKGITFLVPRNPAFANKGRNLIGQLQERPLLASPGDLKRNQGNRQDRIAFPQLLGKGDQFVLNNKMIG